MNARLRMFMCLSQDLMTCVRKSDCAYRPSTLPQQAQIFAGLSYAPWCLSRKCGRQHQRFLCCQNNQTELASYVPFIYARVYVGVCTCVCSRTRRGAWTIRPSLLLYYSAHLALTCVCVWVCLPMHLVSCTRCGTWRAKCGRMPLLFSVASPSLTFESKCVYVCGVHMLRNLFILLLVYFTRISFCSAHTRYWFMFSGASSLSLRCVCLARMATATWTTAGPTGWCLWLCWAALCWWWLWSSLYIWWCVASPTPITIPLTNRTMLIHVINY